MTRLARTFVRNWSVSYHLHVPHHLAADLSALNGGIRAGTTNSSIKADLTGPTWHD